MTKTQLMSVCGFLAFLGSVPMLVQFAHLPFALPLWWNSCQFPLFLVGVIGTGLSAILGQAAGDPPDPAVIQKAVADALAAHGIIPPVKPEGK